jgi:hypothetical protein
LGFEDDGRNEKENEGVSDEEAETFFCQNKSKAIMLAPEVFTSNYGACSMSNCY